MAELNISPFFIKTEIKQEHEQDSYDINFDQELMNRVKTVKKEIEEYEYYGNVEVKQEVEEIKLERPTITQQTQEGLSYSQNETKRNRPKPYYPRKSNKYYPYTHSCYLCHRKFRKYRILQYHWQTTYNMCNLIYQCWNCETIFQTHRALKKHRLSCNNVTGNYKKVNPNQESTLDTKTLSENKSNTFDSNAIIQSNNIVVKLEPEDNQQDNVPKNSDTASVQQPNFNNINPLTIINMKPVLKSIGESQMSSADGAKGQLNPFTLLVIMDQYLSVAKEGEGISKVIPLPIETIKIENVDDNDSVMK